MVHGDLSTQNVLLGIIGSCDEWMGSDAALLYKTTARSRDWRQRWYSCFDMSLYLSKKGRKPFLHQWTDPPEDVFTRNDEAFYTLVEESQLLAVFRAALKEEVQAAARLGTRLVLSFHCHGCEPEELDLDEDEWESLRATTPVARWPLRSGWMELGEDLYGPVQLQTDLQGSAATVDQGVLCLYHFCFSAVFQGLPHSVGAASNVQYSFSYPERDSPKRRTPGGTYLGSLLANSSTAVTLEDLLVNAQKFTARLNENITRFIPARPGDDTLFLWYYVSAYDAGKLWQTILPHSLGSGSDSAASLHQGIWQSDSSIPQRGRRQKGCKARHPSCHQYRLQTRVIRDVQLVKLIRRHKVILLAEREPSQGSKRPRTDVALNTYDEARECVNSLDKVVLNVITATDDFGGSEEDERSTGDFPKVALETILFYGTFHPERMDTLCDWADGILARQRSNHLAPYTGLSQDCALWMSLRAEGDDWKEDFETFREIYARLDHLSFQVDAVETLSAWLLQTQISFASTQLSRGLTATEKERLHRCRTSYDICSNYLVIPTNRWKRFEKVREVLRYAFARSSRDELEIERFIRKYCGITKRKRAD